MKKKRRTNHNNNKPLEWHKKDTQSKRRHAALSSRNGDLLATARALQQVANSNVDSETSRKARSDARYFFKQYNYQKKRELKR
jgi:hypothetical protein